MNEDDRIIDICKKIEREKALIQAASMMRLQTNNDAVRSKLDSQMREGRRNLEFFEEKLREFQMRRLGQGVESMTIGSGGSSVSTAGPTAATPGSMRPRSTDLRAEQDGPPPPPPKDSTSSWGDNSTLNSFSQSGRLGDMQSPSSYSVSPANAPLVKVRPNFTKLDLIKYDTPYLGPRIQHMLSQIQFKLNVEEQYLKGIEKMVQLYQMEGDKKSRADAASKKVESKQKIVLLKQALRRYEELHIDMDSSDSPDDDSINIQNMRKPLSGQLSIRIVAVKDVDHAPTGRFSRGPDTFIAVKVEDNVAARTRLSRTDRWDNEFHSIEVDKANEIELTVYDKPGEHAIPIGMLWVRISDIAEEIRRKRIEAEINSSGWVSADKMSHNSSRVPPPQFPMNPQAQFGPPPNTPGSFSPQTLHLQQQQQQQQQQPAGSMYGAAPLQPPQLSPEPITGWFNLEPTGQIQLSLNFIRQNKDRRPLDLGLGRKGAIRQRKEEVHEMYGHKFVQRQFYNIMRCALCGDFLKGGAGMQCEDCKYTCHVKCYPSVVTKCISKSNAETDPEEEKINHRIPHRFQPFGNYTANCDRTLRSGKPSPTASQQGPYAGHASAQPPYGPGAASAEATEAAKAMYANQASQQRVQDPDRLSGASPTATAAAAASAAMSGIASPGAKAGVMPGQAGGDSSWRYDTGTYEDPYGNQQASTLPNQPQQYGAASQRKYNPADYVNVGQYPPSQTQVSQMQMQQVSITVQAPAQQQTQPAQQQVYPQQQPPPQQPLPPQPAAVVKTQVLEQTTVTASATAVGASQALTKKPLPSATDPGTGQRIGLDHFNFLAVLGKGNFGKVMLAEAKRTKKLYAIKVLKKEFIIENDEVESIRSEKRVFLVANRERHPFLTNLHACFQTETRVYFVEEYISGGDLMLHIQRGQFGMRRAQFYASEVCLALKYFHENGVIYRDLKLDNILLTLDGHIKIADYGLCKEDMWYGSTTSTFCGTPEFMAPEILLDKKYGRAVDWWAFGVLIYQMLLQQSPFRGEDEDEIYDAVLGDEPLYPIHMPRDSVSILQKLLTHDPEQRLGSGPTDAQEVMSQPFFRNINWDDIYHKRVQPPFLPSIKSETDTSNFDSEFTSVTPVLTPVQSVLSQAMQEEFRGFSYTADFV
ncbi:protein kinase c [Niveomyces insectorum RCEF 264]|uniref:Protein kinase C-like n=1 Tax=Niveomyces insectorum RCEF 264 TaxID=1081102 RepID=A0A167YQI3_9HYPO|nr:protein kinase c [Niveomyces insectorum RCEF 264]